MSFIGNIKYSLGLSNYYNNNFTYLIQNLFLFSFLLIIYSLNSSRIINSNYSQEIGSLINTNINSLTIFSSYFLFLISVFIFYFIFINFLSFILVIFSKLFGSNSDIKMFYSLIYPYIFYFNLFLFSFLLLSSGFNFLIYMGFILFYLIIIVFSYSIIKNYSNYLGLSRIFYLILFILGGLIMTLIWYLI